MPPPSKRKVASQKALGVRYGWAKKEASNTNNSPNSPSMCKSTQTSPQYANLSANNDEVIVLVDVAAESNLTIQNDPLNVASLDPSIPKFDSTASTTPSDGPPVLLRADTETGYTKPYDNQIEIKKLREQNYELRNKNKELNHSITYYKAQTRKLRSDLESTRTVLYNNTQQLEAEKLQLSNQLQEARQEAVTIKLTAEKLKKLYKP